MNTLKKGTTISPPLKATAALRNLQKNSLSPVSHSARNRADHRKNSYPKSPRVKPVSDEDDCNVPDETSHKEESSRQRPPEIKQIRTSFKTSQPTKAAVALTVKTNTIEKKPVKRLKREDSSVLKNICCAFTNQDPMSSAEVVITKQISGKKSSEPLVTQSIP